MYDLEHIHVLGFAGSLRKGSYNQALLRTAIELAPVQISIIGHSIAEIPLYNADLDNDRDRPEAVEDFKAAIARADALLIASPEYSHGVSGVLKNALDWASRPAGSSPMLDKPAAIMGATTGKWGTARAQKHLRSVLAAMGTHVLLKPEILVSRAQDKFDEDGRLIDEGTREFVAMMLDNLYEWTLRLRRLEERQPKFGHN
jgi:chromate reductase